MCVSVCVCMCMMDGVWVEERKYKYDVAQGEVMWWEA